MLTTYYVCKKVADEEIDLAYFPLEKFKEKLPPNIKIKEQKLFTQMEEFKGFEFSGAENDNTSLRSLMMQLQKVLRIDIHVRLFVNAILYMTKRRKVCPNLLFGLPFKYLTDGKNYLRMFGDEEYVWRFFKDGDNDVSKILENVKASATQMGFLLVDENDNLFTNYKIKTGYPNIF
jgi:hypothetical protein